MFARRVVLKSLFVAVVGAAPLIAADPPADGSGLQKSFDLRKQLETGLKARRPSDFAYIKTVVAKVENGTLPRDLVTEAFLYARAQNSPYPIVYFQFTLKKLAAKAGIPS